MTTLYETIGLYAVALWLLFRLLRIGVSDILALCGAAIIVALVSLVALDVPLMLMAMFAPFGAVLPALAIQNFTTQFGGYRSTDYHLAEVLGALAVYVLYLCAALGVFAFDPYRFGYQPVMGSVIILVLLAYSLWRGHVFLALALIVGQAAWAFDIGSTNAFDHMTHVILVPVLCVVALQKLFGLWRRSGATQIR